MSLDEQLKRKIKERQEIAYRTLRELRPDLYRHACETASIVLPGIHLDVSARAEIEWALIDMALKAIEQ